MFFRKPLNPFVCLAITFSFITFNVNTWADGPRHPGLYVPPPSSFVLDPSETPMILEFGAMPLADIQSKLDAARAVDPNSPILLTLTGTYWVKDAPLSLPSKTSLVLYGTMKAAPNAMASSLIAITGQSKVAIAGGILDGNHANLAGIDVETSAKVNIDSVTIRNTGKDGIVLSGNGNTAFDSGSAITRCDVSGAGSNGITISAITQALLLDNFIHENAGTGIQMSSAHSSIVNNAIDQNGTGILADANNNLISDNEIRSNKNAGLQLTATSADTATLRNIVASNETVGIDLNGTDNLIYDNTLLNRTNLVDRSNTNWVIARGVPLTAPVSQYFYPPTIDNQHDSSIVNGKNRIDVAINSGNITDVQQAYDAARQQNPDSVIVLHMNGDFIFDGTAPLTLGSYTAVVLNGTIHAISTTATNVITAANPSSFIAISGGTIDLNGRGGVEGIFFPATTTAYIDQVSVINGGVRDTRTSGGMIHLQRGGGYNILYRNHVNQSGGRCIWTQYANAHYVALENNLSNCNMDAVDFDSSTSNSLAIGNNGIDNLRYGVFIEQSDSFNKIYGNFTTTRNIPTPTGHGVGVYNNATSSSARAVTDGNTVFSNISDVINNGLRVGSIATAAGGRAETAHTFLFNNIAKNSTSDGILFDTQFAGSTDNYFSQTVLSGNKTDLDSHPSNDAAPPDFFNPMSAINLALNQPATASSASSGSDPANAVDGLAFTGWIPGDDKLSSWVTVDLGANVSFQRVVLKQTSEHAFLLIRLQSSEDGIHFTDIPCAAETWGSVRAFKFKSLTARFLRVTVWQPFERQAGLQEIAVFPK